MSDFGDDFADFEGGGADARGGGQNYDSKPTGQQGPSFSSDSGDSGDSYVPGQGISLTKAKQEYIPGRGFTFSMPSASDKQRQQRLSGMGDYRNSEAYERYKTETGRSLQNPYGNTGLFSGIFGADRVNYNMDPAQAQNLLDIGFDRYMNFDQQPEYAQKKGFGKLFGSPEGEMTVQGELRAQVPETTTAEGLLSSAIPGASFLPTPGTTYAPMESTSYDPERDPRANQDLRSGPFSLFTDALSKGREFISDTLNPLPDAPPSRPRAPVQETREDIIDTRTPAPLTSDQEFLTFDGSIQNSQREDGLRDNPNLVSDASQYINPMLQFIQDDPLEFNLGDGTIKFTPEGDLKRGLTGGHIEYNVPLQGKSLGLDNLFRMFS
tara:strand:+ start:45 stop:1184 length:1140 start_codon:yes stop_codon:yes gene_type:complete